MYPYEPHSGTHPAPYWFRDDCHSKHYRDSYMNSFSCDDQLPLISSIGRGPKGAGITAKLLKDTDTEFIFSLVDDETGEQVFQSPNLAPAIVSVSAPKHTPLAGENYPITFSMRRGTDVSEYTVDIPSGAQGSLIYCLEDPIHLNSTTENENSGMWFKLANLGDTTFRTTIDHLLIYGENDWTDKPIPRVNDIIFCPYYAEKQDGYSIGVSFGTIEAVENGTVVWTARTFVPSSDIELSENGTWIINGKDSGFVAKGEKGDVGDTGPQGPQGVKGDPFTYADFTESQIAELQRPATEAATRADKATEDAQAAIADVKATEAKLYPVAENVLRGTAKDTFVHVDDAFTGAALREITVEGACKQDGTPSPEDPVPITVIEHPVVKVTGRNLLDPAKMADGEYYEDVNGELRIIANDTRAWETVPVYGKLAAGKYDVYGDSVEFRANNVSLVYTEDEKSSFTLAAESDVKIKIGFGKGATYPFVSHAVLRVSDDAPQSYTPYTSQSLAFTLPAEHPYLAKLPDGTADEIVVDKDGNVSLVARVSEAVINASKVVDWGKGKAIFNFPSDGRHGAASFNKKAVISQVLKGEDADKIYKGTAIGISVGSPYMHNIQCDTALYLGDGINASSIDGISFYYPLMTETRYPLGKIEMPKAQDSIVNVWTDAEVTPRTGIEYTRDVNIVTSQMQETVTKIEERITKVEQALLERATDEDIDEMFPTE